MKERRSFADACAVVNLSVPMYVGMSRVKTDPDPLCHGLLQPGPESYRFTRSTITSFLLLDPFMENQISNPPNLD